MNEVGWSRSSATVSGRILPDLRRQASHWTRTRLRAERRHTMESTDRKDRAKLTAELDATVVSRVQAWVAERVDPTVTPSEAVTFALACFGLDRMGVRTQNHGQVPVLAPRGSGPGWLLTEGGALPFPLPILQWLDGQEAGLAWMDADTGLVRHLEGRSARSSGEVLRSHGATGAQDGQDPIASAGYAG